MVLLPPEYRAPASGPISFLHVNDDLKKGSHILVGVRDILTRNKLPLPLREGVGGGVLCGTEPLPPTPSLKGRGSIKHPGIPAAFRHQQNPESRQEQARLTLRRQTTGGRTEQKLDVLAVHCVQRRAFLAERDAGQRRLAFL